MDRVDAVIERISVNDCVVLGDSWCVAVEKKGKKKRAGCCKLVTSSHICAAQGQADEELKRIEVLCKVTALHLLGLAAGRMAQDSLWKPVACTRPRGAAPRTSFTRDWAEDADVGLRNGQHGNMWPSDTSVGMRHHAVVCVVEIRSACLAHGRWLILQPVANGASVPTPALSSGHLWEIFW